MAENIIRIENLSKSFGEHEVLRKIDISVNKGEVICRFIRFRKIHPASMHQPSGASDQRTDSLSRKGAQRYPERDQQIPGKSWYGLSVLQPVQQYDRTGKLYVLHAESAPYLKERGF